MSWIDTNPIYQCSITTYYTAAIVDYIGSRQKATIIFTGMREHLFLGMGSDNFDGKRYSKGEFLSVKTGRVFQCVPNFGPT